MDELSLCKSDYIFLGNVPSYQQPAQTDNIYMVASQEQSSYQRHPDEYNPEEELETWDNTEPWEAPIGDLDTPESPPLYDKESYTEPIEYDDTKVLQSRADIDQRILLPSLELSLEGKFFHTALIVYSVFSMYTLLALFGFV